MFIEMIGLFLSKFIGFTQWFHNLVLPDHKTLVKQTKLSVHHSMIYLGRPLLSQYEFLSWNMGNLR